MELDYAILAQNAVYTGDLTTIIGAGVSSVFTDTVPCSVTAVVVFNFWMNRNDLRSPHKVEAQLIDEDGNPMPSIAFRAFDFPAQPNPLETDGHIAYNLRGAIKIENAVVYKMGRYAIDLLLDGKPVKRIPFRVHPPQ